MKSLFMSKLEFFSYIYSENLTENINDQYTVVTHTQHIWTMYTISYIILTICIYSLKSLAHIIWIIKMRKFNTPIHTQIVFSF